ncbi:MAG: DUF4292 domain-containing protein [Cyclobacteriaceae bacterium]|nr:DUF4292 domain-containing protein [Cyclobacteriaceae bacterium]
MKVRLPLFIAIVALLSVSCSKKVIPALPPRTLDIEQITFEYLHGKARVVFKDDKKEREVKAHIRIRKDSVIWMTFSVVGVQGGKALINKDSITVVSTVDKEYYVFDYAELSKRFNFTVNYDVIQAAMLGNLINQRKTADAIQEVGTYDLLEQHQGPVSISNYINKSTKKLEKVELKEPTSGNSLTVGYSNFQPLGEKMFPYNGVINLIYKSAAGLLYNNITFEYTKAEVGDKELRFPFNIPKRYDRR